MRKAAHGPIDGGTVRSSVLATAADDGLNGGEYDSGAVKKLILARRMAPFYEGRVEAAQMARAPDSPELPATDNTRSLSASPPPVATRRKHGFFRTRRKTDLADLPAVTELLETVDTECPICFLVCTFPPWTWETNGSSSIFPKISITRNAVDRPCVRLAS